MKKLLITLATTATLARGGIPEVIEALKQIESNGRPNAVSRDGGAVGILQLRRPMVKEVNRILNLNSKTKVEHYTLADRHDPQKSTDMAFIFYTFWRGRWPQMDDVELGGRWYSPKGNAPTWYKERIRKELLNEDLRRKVIEAIHAAGGE